MSNSLTEEEYICIYDNEEILPMTHSVVWMTYTILVEIFMKIGPCILLVTLNIMMIQVGEKVWCNTRPIFFSPPVVLLSIVSRFALVQ